MLETKVKTKRNSSVELLRILSIFMVLFLHMNKDMFILNSFESIKLNSYIMSISESLCIVAVNCFILITGYFSINSKTFKLRKAVNLITVTSFYGVAIYLIVIACNVEEFSIKSFVKCAFPYFFDKVWFINIYIVLYLFIPFINKCLKSLNKKNYTLLLAVMLLIFSVWPSFLPNPPSNDMGYGIVSFVTIYSIGGYLRLHFNKSVNPVLLLIGYFGFSAVTCVLFRFLGTKWINYNSVFIIFAAVCLFLFFAGFSFHSKLINYVSLSVLAVYIIHAHQSIRAKLFLDILNIDGYLNSKAFVIYYVAFAILIFICCIIIDIVRRLVFRFTVDKLIDKINFLNYSNEI